MNYEMGGTILSKTVKEKDLGVTKNANMKVSGSTKLAKCGAFRVCLETIEIPIAILSTCACYKFKASYLSDTECGPCRYITGSLVCLPSPTSNVWKFRLYFY